MIVNVAEILKRGFPILSWSKSYDVDKAISDLVAGITIGLTLIPQVIAYASLAGLSPQYGLYSSLCGGFIYVVFGTVPELNIAPTALVSLLTFSYIHDLSFGPVAGAILLCFLAGVIELFCGLLHLGFLVDFVSTPVVAAFTSAGAITIASAQVKNLLGLKFSAEGFTAVWKNVFEHIGETQKWDAILGVSCCVVLLLMRKLKDYGSPPIGGAQKRTGGGFKKFLWFSSVARNAFVVVGSAVAAYVLDMHDSKPFSLTSQVPAGLPGFGLPVAEETVGNRTVTPLDMMKELGSGIVVIPFVAILSNVAIAKAFANGKVVDATQEMIAVGMCSVIGSFFGSYPVSASFSRAAVSSASGVKTPLAGIYTGSMVILALTFLTPYFSYIPKATLSAVIICAVIFMVEVTLTKMIWDINKIDLVPFVITFICCLLLGIEIGILIGVLVDVVFLLYSSARPKVLIEKVLNDASQDYIRVTPTSAILFPSAEFVREKIMRNHQRYGGRYKFVVIDCQRMDKIDFTAAKCLTAFVSDFKRTGKTVLFYRPKETVGKIILSVAKEAARIVETESDLQEALKDGSDPVTVAATMETETGGKGGVASTNL